MRSFPNSLPLSARIRTTYNAEEMWTAAFECLKQLNVARYSMFVLRVWLAFIE